MLTSHTPETLKAFEQEIAEAFNAGKIRSPVHLESGSEEYLLDIFDKVHETDWLCCTWRSHLKCLLKGVPADELKDAIFAGRSIALCFPKYRVFSSAIVGGSIPIALGLAKMGQRVWCFVGDMGERTGIFEECLSYAAGFNLPITFVVEDNGISVCTPTDEVCGKGMFGKVLRYKYTLPFPHAGAGVRVQF